jgi:uncharacterized protein (TIGR02588 family)
MTPARARRDPGVPPLEWAAGLAGVAIVAVTLAFIGYEIYRGERPAPDLRVEVERAIPRGGGHAVRVVVRNASRGPAASVIVEGRAGAARSEAQVDYVAGLSDAEVTLVFPEAVDRESLSVRVIGYTRP